MQLFGSLTEAQELEVQGFLSRKEQLKKLAYKIECKETLSELEEKDLINSVDNLQAMLNIKNLDKENRESVQILLVIFNGYLNTENKVINLSKPAIKHEIIEQIPEKVANKNCNEIKNSSDSPIAYYFRNRLPGFVAAIVLLLIVLFDVPTTLTTIIAGGGMPGTGVEMITPIINVLNVLLKVAATACIGATMAGIILDIIYISLPFVREATKVIGAYETFISDTAKLAVMQENMLLLPETNDKIGIGENPDEHGK